MYKLSSLKLFSIFGLGAVFTLTACGGGGGDSGTPLVPPTAKLIMTPNIAGVTMRVGGYTQPTKISGGEKPYYVGATGGVIPTVLDDGTLYLLAVAPTANDGSNGGCGSSSSGSGSGNNNDSSVWIQDSSYPQTTLKFNICVDSAPALFSSLGTDPNGPIVIRKNLTFTVYGGTAPYTVYSTDTSVVKISGGTTGGVLGTSTSGIITLTAGTNTVNTATISVSDIYGASYLLEVQASP